MQRGRATGTGGKEKKEKRLLCFVVLFFLLPVSLLSFFSFPHFLSRFGLRSAVRCGQQSSQRGAADFRLFFSLSFLRAHLHPMAGFCARPKGPPATASRGAAATSSAAMAIAQRITVQCGRKRRRQEKRGKRRRGQMPRQWLSFRLQLRSAGVVRMCEERDARAWCCECVHGRVRKRERERTTPSIFSPFFFFFSGWFSFQYVAAAASLSYFSHSRIYSPLRLEASHRSIGFNSFFASYPLFVRHSHRAFISFVSALYPRRHSNTRTHTHTHKHTNTHTLTHSHIHVTHITNTSHTSTPFFPRFLFLLSPTPSPPRFLRSPSPSSAPRHAKARPRLHQGHWHQAKGKGAAEAQVVLPDVQQAVPRRGT